MTEPGGGSISVLVVDDEPDLADLVGTYLERETDRLETTAATNADEALDLLDERAFDCIVSDHDMPGRNGLELLAAVRERDPALPFILYTGKGSEEIASEAITAGVTDYLEKEAGTDQYTVLANRIERAVTEQRAKTALEESQRRLSTLISNLPGIVYRCRNERGWPMEFVSEGAEELTGYTAGELESDAVNWGKEVLIEDEREDLWERVQAALDAREPFEVTYRIRTKDGDIRWMWERGRGVYEGEELVALEGFITDITARKEHEQELESTQARYRTLIDTAPEAILLANAETGTIVEANQAAEELLGHETDALVGMHQTEFAPPGQAEAFAELFAAHVESGEAYTDELPDGREFELATADGETVPVEVSASVVEHEGRRLLQAFFRDVSDRREREQHLEQYRTLVENVGDPMYIADPDGYLEMVNQAMADHLRYERSELEGVHVSMVIGEDDIERGERLIADVLEHEDRRLGTYEIDARAKDGTESESEVKFAVLTDDGEFRGTVGVVRDISERKARERELERFETVIQAVGDPVYTLDEDGQFTFVNEAMAEMTGYDRSTLIGEHMSIVMTEPDLEMGDELIRDLLRSDEDYETLEMDLVTASGGSIPCETHVALLPFDGGRFQGTAGVIRDISERKRREQRLEQFASVVSHDLQNPLNVVMGRIDLAQSTGEVDHLDAAADAADRMNDLIHDLLRLAREGETVGETSPVDVDSIAADAAATVDLDGAALEARADRSLSADPDRLRKLFENLLCNAVEHGDANTITVDSLTEDEGFFVADDGSGLPDEPAKVFEHGYTTEENGTGFGLTIVENIVTAHGWTTRATDSEGGGARFDIVVE